MHGITSEEDAVVESVVVGDALTDLIDEIERELARRRLRDESNACAASEEVRTYLVDTKPSYTSKLESERLKYLLGALEADVEGSLITLCER